jgi:hypothetical protein
VEYNQINILAEYVLYNIIFAKNELMYDDIKVAMFCDIFWRLLEFDPDQEVKDIPAPIRQVSMEAGKNSDVSNAGQSPTLIEFRG